MHCHICGKPIGNEFTLIAKQEGDQWFVIHTGDCALKVEKDWVFVPVRRMVRVKGRMEG
jgi:hypothetical protein